MTKKETKVAFTGTPLPVEKEATGTVTPTTIVEETVTINKSQLDAITEKLKMLEAVADKGRVFNYENANTTKKPFKIKLSAYQGGLIIGWRTIRDQLIKNPTTGLTFGEEQEYEVKVLRSDNEVMLLNIKSYPAFTDARYNERVECEVIGKKEDYSGNITYEVQLPDGRRIELDARFLN